MSKKLRCEVRVKGWHFPALPGLIWHSNNFWFNHEKAPVVYNNGSRAVLVAGTKFGIQKLRKNAQPCDVTILDDMPSKPSTGLF